MKKLVSPSSFTWEWKSFRQLTLDDLYDLLALRERVFIEEQKCSCPEADYRDQQSHHLLVRDSDGTLALYLRVVEKGVRFDQLSIGRVICAKAYRGQGLGRLLMEKAHEWIDQKYGPSSVRIHAQHYLEQFYKDLGYKTLSEPFIEEERPHVEMQRDPL